MDNGGIDVMVDLPRGASARFELLGTVLVGGSTVLQNAASVSLPAGSSLTDPDNSNNQSAAIVSVISFTLHVDGFEEPPQP
jgi:hypothetical protein